MVTGDTADSCTSCAITQARKGFRDRLRLTIVVGEPSLVFEEGQELVQVVVVR
jgi:hypothetical protein